MKTVVALGGEGIGLEVVDATCELLAAAGFPLKILAPPQGETARRTHGTPLPEETKRLCREADAVLFGAAGPASTTVVTWLRWEQNAYASVRPIKYYPGARSPLAHPEGIDYVILRENMEGLYPGREGELADLGRALPELRDRIGRRLADYGEGGFAMKVVTRPGTERIALRL
jgi:isocitrate/isopropylmalate dehydrogenase